MKAICFCLKGEEESEIDYEDLMSEIIAKFGPSCFFCNLEGFFESDCPHFWDAVAEIKHPRHEGASSGVKASKARASEPQGKKMEALLEEAKEPETETEANVLKIDYKEAAWDAMNRVQYELATKEVEQKVKLELENEIRTRSAWAPEATLV